MVRNRGGGFRKDVNCKGTEEEQAGPPPSLGPASLGPDRRQLFGDGLTADPSHGSPREGPM